MPFVSLGLQVREEFKIFKKKGIMYFKKTWVRKICSRRDRLPTPVFLGFPYGSAGKESTCNMGGLGLIPPLGRSPGEGKGYPLHYSGLENSMDFIVHGVSKSWTQLNDFHFHTKHSEIV